MDKVIVNISMGQFDYTAGATLFKQLSLILSAKMKSQIQLVGSDSDGAMEQALAPTVRVNDQLIVQATAGDVIRAVRDTLRRRTMPMGERELVHAA